MYKLITLPNGIKIAFFTMEGVKSVALKAMLTAGPVLEDDTNRGASHFIEHVVLDGTKSHPSKLAFANELESLGISYNGYTSTQEMGFEFDVPYTNIKPALLLLKEILFDPAFSEEIVEKERGVIIEEMQDKENSQDFQFYYTCAAIRYNNGGDHPLARKVIGTREVIESITREELLSLHKKIFVPSNMYFCLTGNFDVVMIEEYMQELLACYSSKDIFKRPMFSNTDLSTFTNTAIQDKKFTNVYSYITFPGFPSEMSVRTELALKTFSSMFGGLRTSRLFQDVREKESLVYSINSEWGSSWGIGTFGISFESDSSKLERILELVFKNIEEMKMKGFTDHELSHIKNYINNRTLLFFSNPWKINQWILDFVFNGEEVLFPEDLIEVGSTINHTDIQHITDTVFDYTHMNVVMMGKLDDFLLEPALKKALPGDIISKIGI